jgi:hypothetical protein
MAGAGFSEMDGFGWVKSFGRVFYVGLGKVLMYEHE